MGRDVSGVPIQRRDQHAKGVGEPHVVAVEERHELRSRIGERETSIARRCDAAVGEARSDDPVALIGVTRQQFDAVRDHLGGGLVAGDHEQHTEAEQLLLGEGTAINLQIEEIGDEAGPG